MQTARLAVARQPSREAETEGKPPMQTPTIHTDGTRQWRALVSQPPARPAHNYAYGASRPELRPVVSR